VDALTRRELIGGGCLAGGALALGAAPGWARKRPRLLREASFPAGVIAGEPRLRGGVLWTQLAQGDGPGLLELEVAADPGFARVVHRERVRALATRDLTAKASVFSRRIRPGERYWYRFATRTGSSPVGRFTSRRPRDSQEAIRVGFFSCQDFSAGYYTAHDALAQEDCDAIVCLGDYMYETNSAGEQPDRADASSGAESGECELLSEYRSKYRLYRSDPALRAMHASATLISTWDDHEVEDNYAGANGGKTADVPVERRIPFEERKRNGYAAFFEQFPFSTFGEERNRLYRHFSLGGLVELFVLDVRQYRDDQPCNDTPAVPCPDGRDPNRTMLGPEQKRWLIDRLGRSRAAWKLLASGVEWMGWDSAPLGGPLNPDGWDGYHAEREEVGRALLAAGVRDVAILTGDVHHFAAGDVTTDGRITGDAFATEFVGGSITSPFLFGPANPVANANATPSELRVRYRAPVTIEERQSEVETLAEFRVARGVARVESA
jgi:alkaline phosphatase D